MLSLGILFRLQDVAGYGVGAAVGKIFVEAFPDRTFKSPLVDLLVKNGRNGTVGFYIYPFCIFFFLLFFFSCC